VKGKESNYAGKDVKGKIVLVSAQPGAVQIWQWEIWGGGHVSYAQNQKTAWFGEDENLNSTGALRRFRRTNICVHGVAEDGCGRWRERLARGEKIRLHAVVKAGQQCRELGGGDGRRFRGQIQIEGGELRFRHLIHQRRERMTMRAGA